MRIELQADDQRHVLDRLNAAEAFETANDFWVPLAAWNTRGL